jgi:hypothetical protein
MDRWIKLLTAVAEDWKRRYPQIDPPEATLALANRVSGVTSKSR